MKPTKESIIQQQLIAYLRSRGIFCWSNATGGYFDAKRKVFRKQQSPYAINGVSDILGLLPSGHFLAIEVKTEKALSFIIKNHDKLKDYVGANKSYSRIRTQINFLDRINGSGGTAFFCDSVESLKYFFTERFNNGET